MEVDRADSRRWLLSVGVRISTSRDETSPTNVDLNQSKSSCQPAVDRATFKDVQGHRERLIEVHQSVDTGSVERCRSVSWLADINALLSETVTSVQSLRAPLQLKLFSPVAEATRSDAQTPHARSWCATALAVHSVAESRDCPARL